VRIKGEIQTLTRSAATSGYVVAGMPIGLGGPMFVIAPGFMQPMFENPPGIAGLPAGHHLLIDRRLLHVLGSWLSAHRRHRGLRCSA